MEKMDLLGLRARVVLKKKALTKQSEAPEFSLFKNGGDTMSWTFSVETERN